MSFVVEAQTRDEGTDECQRGSNNAGRKAHFRLSNTVIAPSEVVGNIVGDRTAKVGANERADQGCAKDKTLGSWTERVRPVFRC